LTAELAVEMAAQASLGRSAVAEQPARQQDAGGEHHAMASREGLAFLAG
jgi:hypothetical protein